MDKCFAFQVEKLVDRNTSVGVKFKRADEGQRV